MTDIEKLAAINAAQVQRLALRLSELELVDLGDDPDEEIEFGFVNDLATGEIVVAIAIDGSTYWEAGRELIEQKAASGRMKYPASVPTARLARGRTPIRRLLRQHRTERRSHDSAAVRSTVTDGKWTFTQLRRR
jgi:hypothetical protein